ncbi:MAG: hypothetical protein JWM63_3699 [Gammaproteobacteria bacterium]|nr:hypothetical protein [Gammaproteobacteria bacterium]
MNTLRNFTVLAALSLAGAAYAQTQATPDPQTGPPLPSQSSRGAPASDDSTPSAASSPHQRDVTSQSTQESTPDANPDPSSAATPHQRGATRMAAAGTISSGMEVKTPSGDSLGTVAAIVPGVSSGSGYVVIASPPGSATAVPYATASAMVRNDALVMDKASLQNAPKVQQDQMEDGSSKTWQKKADNYWSKYSPMSPGHDRQKNPDQADSVPR